MLVSFSAISQTLAEENKANHRQAVEPIQTVPSCCFDCAWVIMHIQQLWLAYINYQMMKIWVFSTAITVAAVTDQLCQYQLSISILESGNSTTVVLFCNNNEQMKNKNDLQVMAYPITESHIHGVSHVLQTYIMSKSEPYKSHYLFQGRLQGRGVDAACVQFGSGGFLPPPRWVRWHCRLMNHVFCSQHWRPVYITKS